jgi:hypothetical protein
VNIGKSGDPLQQLHTVEIALLQVEKDVLALAGQLETQFLTDLEIFRSTA